MKFLTLFLCGTLSWASTLVTGTLDVTNDWLQDGGMFINFSGTGVSVFANTSVWGIGDMLTCAQNCSFNAAVNDSVAVGTASVNGLTSSFFTVAMAGSDTFLSGAVTLYSDLLLTQQLATTSISAYAAARPSAFAISYQERVWDLSDTPLSGQAGAVGAPEPVLYPVFLLLLLLGCRRRELA